MKKIVPPTWYVEVAGETNQKVAEALSISCQAGGYDGGKFQQIRDNLGILHNVWEVPYQIITIMKNNQDFFPYEFKVFVQEGKGFPRLSEFHRLKRPSQTQEAKKAKEFSKEAKAKKAAAKTM